MYAIKLNENTVSILNQRELPLKEIYNEYSNYMDVARAIANMEVRGAPAIGLAGAFGIALAADYFFKEKQDNFKDKMIEVCDMFAGLRPTAANLPKAVSRMRKILVKVEDPKKAVQEIMREANAMLAEDIAANKTMGKHGSKFFSNGDTILTHCNAGALATGGYGTALGVVRAAYDAGKKIQVIACETRPLFQGARLTAWELMKDKIPVTVITDGMAGWFMKKRIITKVITGADRIAANGDTANKIGTYSLSVLAKEHNIPFYVAAPTSTIDAKTPNGEAINIEERSVDEVAFAGDEQIVPEGVRIFNPAFDVTPAGNITAIITERGVCENPDEDGISALLKF